MSWTSVSCPCGRFSLVSGLLLLASSLLPATGRPNCTHPLVPENLGFRCEPSPCRGFSNKVSIRFFCAPGHQLSARRPTSRCLHGRWSPPVPACVPLKGGPGPRPEPPESTPSIATTAVGVSIFLLTTTVCLVVKSRLYPCQSRSRRSSDQLDLMADGPPVSLPSYEEAVYGSWGQRLPSCSAPGPTQLLLAQEAPGPPRSSPGGRGPPLSAGGPDSPPPPYEEVQPPPPLQLHVRVTDDKDS